MEKERDPRLNPKMKKQAIQNSPRFRESILIHRDVAEDTGDVSYSAVIPEYDNWKTTGHVSRTEAYEQALREIRYRLSQANSDLSAQLSKQKRIFEEACEKKVKLEQELTEVVDVIEQSLNMQRDLTLQIVNPADNADISDGSPAELIDDEKMIYDTLVRYEGSDAGTIAWRWQPDLDADGKPKYDFDRDGDTDHRMVIYPTRQPG